MLLIEIPEVIKGKRGDEVVVLFCLHLREAYWWIWGGIVINNLQLLVIYTCQLFDVFVVGAGDKD